MDVKVSTRHFEVDPYIRYVAVNQNGRIVGMEQNGIRYVVIRYGLQYQLIFPYEEGHISIGVELKANITGVAQKIAKHLSLSV